MCARTSARVGSCHHDCPRLALCRPSGELNHGRHYLVPARPSGPVPPPPARPRRRRVLLGACTGLLVGARVTKGAGETTATAMEAQRLPPILQPASCQIAPVCARRMTSTGLWAPTPQDPVHEPKGVTRDKHGGEGTGDRHQRKDAVEPSQCAPAHSALPLIIGWESCSRGHVGFAARNSCRSAAMKKQPNASVPNGNGWPPSRRIAPASPMRTHSRGGAPWRRAARASAPTAAIQPSDPTMLRANGGPNAGQSLTTSKTPSCCTAERSRALRIASPVAIPATASYALKKTRKTPIPTRVTHALARP